MSSFRLPPGQQLAAPLRWPIVGEKEPLPPEGPWSVELRGEVARPVRLSLKDLAGLPRVDRAIDLHCVTRWSMPAVRFGGVLLKDALELAGPLSSGKYVSFVAASARDHSTSLPLDEALALETLIALSCDGAPLPTNHGGPVRTVVPGRYFYKSLKWLVRIELLREDRLGYWEAAAGYHNRADPWLEERFLASSISKQQARQLVEVRDISGRELRGLRAAGLDLSGLKATGAILRDADFRRAKLAGADFRGANLSLSRMTGAELRNADLRDAALDGVDFSGSDLRGADLRGAEIIAATFFTRDDSGKDLAARIDPTTILDRSRLVELMPEQENFVRAQSTGPDNNSTPS